MAARTRYVDAASAGGDGTTTALSGANAAYATLNAALVAEYAATPNLVTAVGILTIKCVGTTLDAGGDVTTATAPFTTDATNYLVVETPLADRTANPWVWSASRYRWVRSSGQMWAMRNVRVVLRGLQIEDTLDNVGADIIGGSPNSSGHHVTIEECLLRLTGAANSNRAIEIVGSSAGTLIVRNTIIITTSSTTGGGINCANTNASTNVYLDNNTIIGQPGTGILQSSLNVVTARNNLVTSTTGFSGSITQSYNATTDATAAGTGSRTSQTFTFENAAGGDYRITSSDAGARTFGTDLSGDANDPFSTDYAQTTRGATWDIGAHQVTAASSAKRPLWLL